MLEISVRLFYTSDENADVVPKASLLFETLDKTNSQGLKDAIDNLIKMMQKTVLNVPLTNFREMNKTEVEKYRNNEKIESEETISLYP